MDLIERQKAIDALADMHCKSDEDGYVWIIRSDAWARIDALPSVQPEPCEDAVSRKAAIEKIKNYCENGCDYAEDNWCPSCQREKFVELLKALPSAQPERTQERTGTHACDSIDRQAAIDLVKDVCDAIMSCCGSHYDEETDDEVYDDIREIDAILKCNKEMRIALKNMPSAEPERKTGKWIPHEDEDGEHYGDKCSECGEWYVMPYGKTNYCPNCGADMRGEQDDESRSKSNAQTDTRARGMGTTDKSSGI